MAPPACLHGTLLSTWQSGPSRTQQSSLAGDPGAQGRALRQVGAGAVVNTGPCLPLRTVLELGSGAGLTGLAICKACHPRAFIFSDCHGRVLEQLRGNVLLNGFSLELHPPIYSSSPKVTVAELDWDKVTASQLSAFQADVVIAAGNAPAAALTQEEAVGAAGRDQQGSKETPVMSQSTLQSLRSSVRTAAPIVVSVHDQRVVPKMQDEQDRCQGGTLAWPGVPCLSHPEAAHFPLVL